MLRLKTNRRKALKSKIVDKTPSKQYEESYNEIILNDLVPENKKSEFGLESETPKVNTKKSNGLKLNLGVNKKKSTKDKNNKATNNKEENNIQNHKKEILGNNKNTEVSDNKNKSSKNKKSSKNNLHKNKSSKNNKVADNNENNTKTKKNHKNSKSNKNNIEEVKKENNNNSPIDTQKQNNKSKKNLKSKNTRRRKHIEKDDSEFVTINTQNSEDIEVEDTIDSDDSIGLRSEEQLDTQVQQEESNIEIQEVKQKFENLVWSEDKFPKK